MNITRRELIQQIGWGWLTLGISQATLNHPLAALAAPNPRKLALLVGINNYGANIPPLHGCLTDVELQKNLLRYRFGFQAADILTLTGEKATREVIATAFLEHLIAQAKPGDVVIFHFSGYGSVGEGKEVFIPSNGSENALLKENILLLARCLATDKSTLIFDSSHTPKTNPNLGNLRIRSYPTVVPNLNPTELTFAEDIKTRFNLKNKPNNSIVFCAAQPNQVALELSGNSPNAGLFTYDLTQYLWQTFPSPTIAIAFPQLRNLVASHTSQQQQPAILANSKNNSSALYQIKPEKSRGGVAFVTNIIDNQTVELILTGLPREILENYGLNSCLSFIDGSGDEITLQILSRQGLKAKAQLLSSPASLEKGQILAEKLRIFASKIGLIVGLDHNLTRIERVDATSTFASLPDVTAVVNAGEQVVDCLLSRVGSEETGNYQLLSPNGSLILGSLAVANEAIKSGIKRLETQLETLLAIKLWHLLINQESSGLAVSITLESIDKTYSSRRQTKKATSNTPATKTANYDLILPLGTEIRYQIDNQEEQPLYGIIISLDSTRQPLLFCSCQENSDNLSNPRQLAPFVVAPYTKATIPNSGVFHWKISKPIGISEHLLILSRNPFPKTVNILNATHTVKGESAQLLTLNKPLEVARAFWADLKLDLGLKMDSSGSVIDEYAFDLGTWVGCCFIYQIVS
jgi:Caspase domain